MVVSILKLVQRSRDFQIVINSMPQNTDWGGLKTIIQYLCCSYTRRPTWPEQSPELPPDLRAGAQSLRTQSQRLPRHWAGNRKRIRLFWDLDSKSGRALFPPLFGGSRDGGVGRGRRGNGAQARRPRKWLSQLHSAAPSPSRLLPPLPRPLGSLSVERYF